MNCTSFRKYVGAFADGELDTKLNLDALEHLNMCPNCAGRVAHVQELKAALKRVLPIEAAPSDLKQRVLEAVEVEAGGSPRVLRLRRLTRLAPLAAAAAVVFAVVAWQVNELNRVGPGTHTVIAAQAAADTRTQHRDCVESSDHHHDQSLTRDLPIIEDRLGDRLELAVIAPDLSDHDFELVGADRCGIRGRLGAHVLYHCDRTGDSLSVFTLDRVSDFDLSRMQVIDGRKYFISADEDLTVLAWNEGAQTYVMCAKLPEKQLVAMADPIRTRRLD